MSVLALLVAIAVSCRWEPMPLEERLVQLQAEETFSGFAEIQDESIEIQALLLDYHDDRLLLLKAQAALLKYPELAREILPLYGQEPEFQDILRSHGESVLPPIHYFLTHEVRSVALLHYTSQHYQAAKDAVVKFWGSEQTAPLAPAPTGPSSPAGEAGQPLTPQERGWYAVNFIAEEGNGFLGQFVVDDQGNARWIQTERFLEGANGFFASGFRNLETRVQTGEDISAGDAGWAAVDALVVVGAVKFLRMGRAAATSTRSAGLAGRSAAYGSRLARAGRIGLTTGRYAKWPAALALGYVAVTHPQVISEILAGAAAIMGLPVRLVQVLGWMLVLIPVLYLGSWVLRLFIRPAIGLLRGLIRLLSWAADRRRGTLRTTPQAEP